MISPPRTRSIALGSLSALVLLVCTTPRRDRARDEPWQISETKVLPLLFPVGQDPSDSMFEFPVKEKFGWSVEVPAGPLTRPLNFTKEILKTSRIPAGAECSLLKERLDALGLNGLLEIADWENWHLIGQLAISHARRKGVSDKAAFTNIVNIAAAAFSAIRDEGAYSIWHGSLWYAVSQPGGIDYSWSYLMSNICTKTKEYMPYSFYGSCFHGIAHGVLYHYTQPPFDECSTLGPVNTSKTTAIDQVYAYCDSAPNMGLKQACFSGMFHALSETELVPYPSSWSFPCDRYTTGSAWCFFWLFFTSVIDLPSFGFKYAQSVWRRPLLQSAGSWPSWCLQETTMSEGTILGCIYGLSDSLAVLYDHVFAARDERGFLLQPTMETCLQVPSLLPYLTDVPFFCGVLFDQGPVSNYSAATLVDFCSYFVDPARISSRKEQRRWLACVHGSMSNFIGVADAHSLELKTTVGYCRQLFHVEWQPAALREESYELCTSIWAFNLREYTWEVDTELWSYVLEL